ncbi:MAG: hypothetical protein A3B99_00275 [Candidatus Yanofskybacteria bacterium RIFCSPHIGHO2_02_FULL_44_12b]|uniref:Glycosyl transferase family 1 domain-containing protein n=2 Tax=Candidatus Yanofskyibacteriota TaxID=1752733 RepID=A0A1F8GKQ6_9BACT|nr:MAG: Glycosyl transferase group 1 [Candidatus Yanofskybacteria bacterium GW2011_GWA2_44_9]OGN04187.1 MAG: hypothetical protein A2659_01720 [Candidatus Yanofskybacteria bacterium RIFCSPHIGHO2_01_FULL_44_24]OGN14781.1 MAG: hypothetical protein A3B99_00275 [Candidatus Yanofskybacteria bacterium RIFCSPHIGHO2_02_FULL_44_12b]OGN25913.1 MAG: hypothetical protein A2925_02640 [Candidatus Yanofskybacteria bacterium RIFCSPLOWO2_01_FULL_44_22]
MLKIGIECENLEDSKSRWGIGQITLNLLKEYAANPEWQKKYKLYLYFKKRIPDDDFFKIHNSKFIIRVSGVPSFNIYYHLLMPLRAMIDRIDWMFFPAYQLPPLYLRKSIVVLTPDVYYEYKQGNLPLRYRLSYRLFTNWAAWFATKILAISETSKKEVANLYWINPKRIFVSHLGISSDQNIENSKLKIENSTYILYVGQMFPRRHARETILAFQKIAYEFPDLKLILVGTDKYRPAIIRELVEIMNQKLKSERIIYFDYLEKREDIEKLYTGARALVYVSDREAFGLPPMEALAFGVSPVIMDNELGHELFGDYAFYSKDGGADGIIRSVRQALTDGQKIQKIKSEGPKFVKRYSWKGFTERFFEQAN